MLDSLLCPDCVWQRARVLARQQASSVGGSLGGGFTSHMDGLAGSCAPGAGGEATSTRQAQLSGRRASRWMLRYLHGRLSWSTWADVVNEGLAPLGTAAGFPDTEVVTALERALRKLTRSGKVVTRGTGDRVRLRLAVYSLGRSHVRARRRRRRRAT